MTETNSIFWSRRRRRRSLPPCGAVNCRVGSWTNWSACSHQCGTTGTKTRTRQQTQAASCGSTCPYNFQETQACNRDNCQNGGTPYISGCSCRAGYNGMCCEQGASWLRPGSHLWNFAPICVCFRLKICHHVTFPNATGFSPVSKKLEKPTKLQTRRIAWVGQADFEKIEENKGSRIRSCHR